MQIIATYFEEESGLCDDFWAISQLSESLKEKLFKAVKTIYFDQLGVKTADEFDQKIQETSHVHWRGLINDEDFKNMTQTKVTKELETAVCTGGVRF